MDNINLQKPRTEIKEMDLENIRQNEIVVSDQLQEKVLAALANGSVSRRQLSRVTRLKRVTVDAIVKSLVGRGIVKVVTVTNSSGGRPTLFISLARSEDETRQKRLAAMYRLGV